MKRGGGGDDERSSSRSRESHEGDQRLQEHSSHVPVDSAPMLPSSPLTGPSPHQRSGLQSSSRPNVDSRSAVRGEGVLIQKALTSVYLYQWKIFRERSPPELVLAHRMVELRQAAACS